MGHIPYPAPQDADEYEEGDVSEGDIVRIESPEQLSEDVPEKLVGEPLTVDKITDSELTVTFDGESYTIPIASATPSTRTPPEIVGAILDHFK